MTEKFLMIILRENFKQIPTSTELKNFLKEMNIEVEDFKRIASKLEDYILSGRKSKTYIKMSSYTKKEIQEMYNKMTVREMSAKIGINFNSLQNYLYTNRIYKGESELLKGLKQLYLTHTDKEISEIYGKSSSYITNLRHKHKLKKTNRKVDYKNLWKEFKEYTRNINPNIYLKMDEFERG